MLRRNFVATGVLALASFSTLAQWSPNMPRMALVVGNGAYKSGPLKSPLNDASLMQDALKSAGFPLMCSEIYRTISFVKLYPVLQKKWRVQVRWA